MVILVSPSIVSILDALIIMLLMSATPPSSFMTYVLPDVEPDAIGKLIMIEDVTFVVTTPTKYCEYSNAQDAVTAILFKI